MISLSERVASVFSSLAMPMIRLNRSYFSCCREYLCSRIISIIYCYKPLFRIISRETAIRTSSSLNASLMRRSRGVKDMTQSGSSILNGIDTDTSSSASLNVKWCPAGMNASSLQETLRPKPVLISNQHKLQHKHQLR
jgi:hypothetical protein